MATASDVLRIAAGEIGYYAPADPLPGSKYGRWMAQATGEGWLAGPSREIWWCCIFTSWCLAMAGQTMEGMPNYNCDSLKSRARSRIIASKRDARPGDLVLFDWGGDGGCDHIGIVELNKGSYIQTIEGNTSSGSAGSQSAGNGVWRRTRSWGVVNCVIRPPYSGRPSPSGGEPRRPGKGRPEVAVIPDKVYRAYNPSNGDHLLAGKGEYDKLVKAGWRGEGEAFGAATGMVPVYRLYNPNSGEHFYTTSNSEANHLVDVGWAYEGIGFYGVASGGVPIHRLCNPNAKPTQSAHVFTRSDGERKSLMDAGWRYEGVAWRAAS